MKNEVLKALLKKILVGILLLSIGGIRGFAQENQKLETISTSNLEKLEPLTSLCARMDETTSPSKFSIQLQGGEQG